MQSLSDNIRMERVTDRAHLGEVCRGEQAIGCVKMESWGELTGLISTQRPLGLSCGESVEIVHDNYLVVK